MPLIVRDATPADVPAIAALYADEVREHVNTYEYDMPDDIEMARRMQGVLDAGYPYLVAELDGRVVGCLATSIMHVLHRPGPVGRISMMVVEEGLRSQGIGAELVRAAEAWLKQQGCGMIEVTSNVKRTDAHRFYERLGYERTSWRFAIDSEQR